MGRPTARRTASPATAFVAVAAAYVVLATAAFDLFGADDIGVTFFPPAGLTFTAFLLLRPRLWPSVAGAVIAGELVVDMVQGNGFWWSLGWAAANLGEPFVGAAVARRVAPEAAMNRRFALAFLLGGLVSGPIVGASVGATVQRLDGDVAWLDTFPDVWVGDALGVLVVAPLLLVLARPQAFVTNRTRPLDWVWVAAVTAILTSVLVASDDRPLGYAAAPLLAVPAARFSSRELAVAGSVVAGVLTAATARGRGPWGSIDAAGAHVNLVQQQAFLLVALGTAWLLKLEVLDRVKAVADAAAANAELDAARERERDRRFLDAMNDALRDLASASTTSDVLAAVERHAGPVLDASFVSVTLAEPMEPARVVLASGTEPASPSGAFTVPLSLGSRQGSIRLARRQGQPWSEPGQIRAMAFASLLSESLERVQRYESDHRVALTLQRAIMPGEIAPIAGAAISGRYLPATRTLEVGGDWYDVVVDDEARTATLVIGDVVGHSLSAAAAMGKLASAARALAYAGHPPDELLRSLDLVAANTDDARMTTMVCAQLDLRAHRLHYSAAGHPPPLLRAPDGTVTVLNGGRSVPLAGPGLLRRPAATAVAPRGSALLLYTDGLVEHRGVPLDVRIGELADAFALAGDDAADVCERVLDKLLAAGAHDDDVAIVCVTVD